MNNVDKEAIRNNLITASQLAKRWGYSSSSTIRKRRSKDRSFPKPLLVAEGRYVYWLPDVIAYEKMRPGLGDGNRTYMQTKEEWKELSEVERADRQNPYFENLRVEKNR